MAGFLFPRRRLQPTTHTGAPASRVSGSHHFSGHCLSTDLTHRHGSHPLPRISPTATDLTHRHGSHPLPRISPAATDLTRCHGSHPLPRISPTATDLTRCHGSHPVPRISPAATDLTRCHGSHPVREKKTSSRLIFRGGSKRGCGGGAGRLRGTQVMIPDFNTVQSVCYRSLFVEALSHHGRRETWWKYKTPMYVLKRRIPLWFVALLFSMMTTISRRTAALPFVLVAAFCVILQCSTVAGDSSEEKHGDRQRRHRGGHFPVPPSVIVHPVVAVQTAGAAVLTGGRPVVPGTPARLQAIVATGSLPDIVIGGDVEVLGTPLPAAEEGFDVVPVRRELGTPVLHPGRRVHGGGMGGSSSSGSSSSGNESRMALTDNHFVNGIDLLIYWFTSVQFLLEERNLWPKIWPCSKIKRNFARGRFPKSKKDQNS